MLNIPKHKGNAKQNYSKSPLHSHFNNDSQKIPDDKTVGENVEKLQPLCTVGRNAHGAAAGDSSVAVSQKIRNTTAM